MRKLSFLSYLSANFWAAMPRLLGYSILLFGLLLAGPVDRQRGGSAAAEGSVLTAGEWRGIREAHESWKREVRRDGDGWRVFNSEQRLTTTFDGRGFEVRTGLAEWRWGLELESYGVGSEQRRIGKRQAAVKVDGARIGYGWDETIEEWVVNERAGIEHGFTVRRRPEGEGRLAIRLRVRGGMRPVGRIGGRSLAFGIDGQAARLGYENLRVWDARGAEVGARFAGEGPDVIGPDVIGPDVIGPDVIRIEVDDDGAVYPLTIDPTITQQGYLKASTNGADGYGDDHFGAAVAISGDLAVIGAPGERSRATGVQGDESDNTANDSGAAYVFVRNGTGWTQQAYLKASNTGESDAFGSAVAISGETVVIGALHEDSAATGMNGNQADNGAPDSGAVYVFTRNGGVWSQQAYVKASNTGIGDFFGGAVAIAGETMVVGALNESSGATGVNGNQGDNGTFTAGAAYVFVRSGGVWSQQAYLKASNTGEGDQFGTAVGISGETVVVGAFLESSGATGVNGNQGDNGSFGAGAAYVFVRSGGVWSQQAYLKASNTDAGDFFGRAVAISSETVVIGARYEGSGARSINGDEADDSVPEVGAAYVFVRNGAVWSQQAYLKASNGARGNGFGASVAIAGGTVVVGARGESSASTGVNGDQEDNRAIGSGSVYVFVRSGTAWSQQAYLKASNTSESSRFGVAVAVSGETVIVGADNEPSSARLVNGDGADRNAEGAGAAYVFVRSAGAWSQQAYLKASNTEEFYGPDYFGGAVAISGETVVIGAWGEDSAATGVNGNELDTSAKRSGAAYVFVRSGTVWSQQAYLKPGNTGADDNFGYAVAISGETVVIGAPHEDSAATGVNGNQGSNGLAESGAAYVFVRSGTIWSQQAYLKASNTGADDRFGSSVGISGGLVVVGAPLEDSGAAGVNGLQADNSKLDAGAAYLFVRSGTGWSQQAYLKASNSGTSDNFGVAVAISGETLVVGAFGESSPATGVNGDQSGDDTADAGAVYVFVRSVGVWSQQAYLKASNPNDGDTFGRAVAISGETVVVGASGEDSTVTGGQSENIAWQAGAVYVFVRSGTTWSQQAFLKASNARAGHYFGWSVAISGETVVVGADSEDSVATGVDGNQSSNFAPESGAAYVFVRSGTTWSQQSYLKAGNTGFYDRFGVAVAVGAGIVVVGAEAEDSATAGVNGVGTDNNADDSGAAYIFVTDSSAPQILSLSPAAAAQNGAAFTLTVNGTGFVAGSVVRWNGAARPTTFVSATQLTASISGADLATAGSVIVTVSNGATGGGVSNEATFTVTAPNPLPILTGLAPGSAVRGSASLTLTVSGSGFVSGAVVQWNGESRTTSFVSPTQLTAQITATDLAVVGTAQVTVVNPSPGGGVSNALAFSVTSPSDPSDPGPTISSLSPETVFAGSSGFTLTVTGTGFSTGARVEVDGSERTTTFVSATVLTATIAAADVATTGTRQISVRSPSSSAPAGRLSNALPLAVIGLPPALVAVSPERVIAGGAGFTLTVLGKIFLNGAVLRINGSDRPTTLVSEIQVTAAIPATDIATAGQLRVTVVNPGAAVSNEMILPVLGRVTSVSAASYAAGDQAPGAILAAFAATLATGVEVGSSVPLPTTLRGTRVVVTDSANVSREQPLFFVAPQQVNYQLHPETAIGPALVTVYIADQAVALGELQIGNLAPAIFTQNATGDGVPAAYGLRVRGTEVTATPILAYDTGQSRWVPLPLDPGTEKEQLYLVLFGTGFRRNSGLSGVDVRIGTTSVPVLYAGEAPGFVGLDQLNIGPIPLSLAGAGLVELRITVDGRVANQAKVMQLSFGSATTSACQGNTLIDIDGNKYATVSIGSQCWMAENLQVTRYRDGTAIPLDQSGGVAGNGAGQTWALQMGARTVFGHSSVNLTSYGYLYNWPAVSNSKGLCPTGWHVPTDAEWGTLVTSLGANAGGKLRATGTTFWTAPNTGATNESGFSALPGGIRSESGSFDGINQSANFWSSSEVSALGAWSYVIGLNNSLVSRNDHGKKSGVSVRCLKD